MKYAFFMLTAATLFSFASCKNITIQEDRDGRSSRHSEKTYAFSDFKKLDVSSSIDVYITQGDTYAVKVSGSKDELENIDVRLQDGVLHLGSKSNFTFMDDFDPKVYITMPVLERLHTSGSCDVDFQNIFEQASPVFVSYSGAGDIDLNVKAPQLNLNGSGAGDVSLKGTVSALTLDISGAGDIDGADLVADSASISVSGAGDISVNVSKHLDIDASGAASIRYKGNPTIRQKTSGVVSISKEN